MPPAQALTPSRILGDLLATHPEAAALLAEASHRQALAAHSAAAAGQSLTAERAARLRHQELRHLLDPRCRRGIHLGLGLVLLGLLTACLTVLNRAELGGVLGRTLATEVAIAAASAWLAGAWLSALASREGRRGVIAALASAAVALELLLAAIYDVSFSSGRGWIHACLGGLMAALIVMLAAAAAVLIGSLEPAPLLLARRRWRRHEAEHETAVRQARADTEAAAIAVTAWLGLVRTHIAMVCGGSEGPLVHDTLRLAAALHEPSWPRLP